MNIFNGISALIFDMDGTLVDNMPVHFQAWYDLFTDLGLSIGRAEVVQLTNGKTTREIILEVLGNGLSQEKMDEIAERKEFHYRASMRGKIKPLPGLRPFLHGMKRTGMPLAVATSAGKGNIQFIMETLRLAEYFPVIVGGHEVQHGKPAPDLYLEAARRLDVNPGTCLVFEDSKMGLQAANRAGMQAVAVSTGLSEEELASEPNVTMVIRDYTGFKNLR